MRGIARLGGGISSVGRWVHDNGTDAPDCVGASNISGGRPSSVENNLPSVETGWKDAIMQISRDTLGNITRRREIIVHTSNLALAMSMDTQLRISPVLD